MSPPAKFPWTQVPEPAGGTRQSGYVQLGDAPVPDSRIPYIAVRGGEPGPAIVILVVSERTSGFAGFHGTLRLSSRLVPDRVRGSLLILLDVNRTAGAVGSGDGRYQHGEWATVFESASGLIELTTAPMHRITANHVTRYRSPYTELNEQNTELNEQTKQLAIALGFPYVLTVELSESSRAVAAGVIRQGKPALRVTIDDDLVKRGQYTDLVFDGLVNVLRGFGAFGGVPVEHDPEQVELVGSASAVVDGFWEPAVRIGQRIRVNDELGTMYDTFGENLGQLVATQSGIVLSYSRAVSVGHGEPLVRLVRRCD